MRLGFSGTQSGMSAAQYSTLDAWLHENKALLAEIHHGGCIGADAEFHNLVGEHGLWKLVHVHPCNIYNKTAQLRGTPAKVWPVDFALERNLTIVQHSDIVIVTPKEDDEVRRSGTWATVRRARKLRRLIKHIRLDGTFDQ
jgi:hypothetical protein